MVSSSSEPHVDHHEVAPRPGMDRVLARIRLEDVVAAAAEPFVRAGTIEEVDVLECVGTTPTVDRVVTGGSV
jgi:hypothetical protein